MVRLYQWMIAHELWVDIMRFLSTFVSHFQLALKEVDVQLSMQWFPPDVDVTVGIWRAIRQRARSWQKLSGSDKAIAKKQTFEFKLGGDFNAQTSARREVVTAAPRDQLIGIRVFLAWVKGDYDYYHRHYYYFLLLVLPLLLLLQLLLSTVFVHDCQLLYHSNSNDNYYDYYDYYDLLLPVPTLLLLLPYTTVGLLLLLLLLP